MSPYPLTGIATHNLSFQQVYGKLETALHFHKEAHLAQLKDKESNALRQTDEEPVPVHYFGQGRFPYPQKGQCSIAKGFNSRTIAGCFKCDDRDHFV